MQEAVVVRRETHVPAPPAAVFALLTDPEKILRWMGTEAQVDPQPGGLYLVNVTGARTARGSFREVVPVHRLAYSFGWDDSEVVPPGSSLVEIDLIEQPDGTLMRLTHTGLPMTSNAPVMRKAGPITSAGWPRLRPGATPAQTPGMAALDEQTLQARAEPSRPKRRPITALLRRATTRIRLMCQRLI